MTATKCYEVYPYYELFDHFMLTLDSLSVLGDSFQATELN
jgi:hypothetical protein